eukprot:527667_1
MGNCKGSKPVQPVSLMDTLADSNEVMINQAIRRANRQNNNNNNNIVNPGGHGHGHGQNHINNTPTNETVRTEAVEPSSSDESTSPNEIEVTATFEMDMASTNDGFNEVALEEKSDVESLDDDQNTANGASESKTSDENA